jgi:hypothetical protein
MVTTKVGNRRLLKLATFLKTVPPHRFNYAHWAGNDWKGDPNLTCGTTACALGWATAMPFFRRLGLHLKRDVFGTRPYVSVGEWDEEDAAGIIFGLTGEESRFLFFPGEFYDGRYAPAVDATPKMVARHIEEFVKGRT